MGIGNFVVAVWTEVHDAEGTQAVASIHMDHLAVKEEAWAGDSVRCN